MYVAAPERSILASPVGALMRPVGRIAPEDSLERAALELRRNGGVLVPVVANDILLGIVTDTSLAVAMAEGTPPTAAAETAIVRPETIAPYSTGAEALRRLAEGDGRPLIVVDDLGRPMGQIGATDLYPFRRQQVRPAMAGGMATPFGVYLMAGNVTAGASRWWALVATGATLFGLLLFADVATIPVSTWLEHMHVAPSVNTFLGGVLVTALFLLSMRLIPLSGTHGAEHQVVHAIERGEELTPEVVRRMPRVHPRCGTNLAVGASIFLSIFFGLWPPSGELRFVLAAILTFYFWRPIGAFFQQYITTRRPSDRQLAGAIRAGQELLDRYATTPDSIPSIPRRIWNTGLPMVLAGSTLTALAAELIGKAFHVELGLW